MPNQAIPPFIKYDDTLHKGQDYFFLRNEGIRLAQELAGDIWTDYNEHDPGVTILEQVCYALTDIAYRTHIDIDKLLFSEGTTSTVAFDNALFLPEQILLSPVVTFKDLRTLFIDRVHELRNIWFRSAKDSKYKGIYDVHVLPHHGRLQEDDLQAKISKLYSSHRNLCEDLGEVVIKKAEQIVVSVHLNLDQDAPIEGTLAAAYYALYTYFTPQLTYASFEALQEQGHD
ncbi:MAG TPA: hypothetical protein VL947_09170, partial [Cytophagales bacterium]|nr:hypothetical protein [Cytophagales bacterium]